MQKHIRRGLVAVAVPAVGLFAWSNLVGAGHENVVLETELKGRNEVATGATNRGNVGDPNGRGEAYVFGIDGDPNTLCYVLTVSKIEPAKMAHIHRGAAGSNGPVVVNLAAPADGNAADCLTVGEPDKFLMGQTVQEILANPESFYVNVHNAKYPAGAIRGQLQPQS